MRTLVTGGTGFIGSNLVFKLLDEGHEVFATGTPGEVDLAKFPVRVLPQNFAALDWATLGPIDAVFHQAANNDTTLLDHRVMVRVNVEDSLTLFDQAITRGCRHIVYASSCSVYGDTPAPFHEDGPFHPLNPYAESKLLLDERAMAFAKKHPDTIVVGLRYSNVYGPRESSKGKRATMIYQFAQQMQRGNPKLFKHGEQKRDYIYVGDAVRANLLAAQARTSAVVNCGSGTSTSFNELVRILNETLKLQRTPDYISNPHEGRYQDFTQCDMTRAKDLLGFVPAIDIREGIRRYHASGFLV